MLKEKEITNSVSTLVQKDLEFQKTGGKKLDLKEPTEE